MTIKSYPAGDGLVLGGNAASSLTLTTSVTNPNYAVVTGSEISVPNPGRNVLVKAQGGGYLTGTTAGDIVDFRVGISLDGGTTWTYGTTPATDVAITGDPQRVPVFTDCQVIGVATGDVHARLEMRNRSAARNVSISQAGITSTVWGEPTQLLW